MPIDYSNEFKVGLSSGEKEASEAIVHTLRLMLWHAAYRYHDSLEAKHWKNDHETAHWVGFFRHTSDTLRYYDSMMIELDLPRWELNDKTGMLEVEFEVEHSS